MSYFDITTWSKLVEVCKEYLTKGRGVRIVGRLKQDRWTNEEDKTSSKVHIIAEHVEFKPKFKNNQENDQEQDLDEQEEGGASQNNGLLMQHFLSN